MTPSPRLSRRSMLGAATGAGAALLGSGAAEARARMPLASTAQLQEWTHEMASMGIRLTGSPAQATYVDWLADQWRRAGLHVRADRHTLTRWTPHAWTLRVDGKPVDVSFYFPYSGVTGPRGVTAPMVYVGPSPVSDGAWSGAAGKIAVIDVAAPPVPLEAAFPAHGRYPAGAALPGRPGPELAVTDIVEAPALDMAARAGVEGVVCLRSGVSDALAADQYSPFTTGYMGCPAVWVAPSASGEVRRAALAGANATLTMHATLTPRTATETIWAVLPGAVGKEAIVLNTHSDGPNIAEENGGLGLLSLARHFASIPRGRRRRSLVFVATTGHFQLPQFAVGSGQSASRWIADHPGLVDGSTLDPVAALTLEHLGCREWLDDVDHQHYAATGAHEPGWVYVTTGAMRRAYLRSAVGTGNTRTFTCTPGAIYLGEGADFHTAGIATASLIPGPSYLVAAQPGGSPQHIDYRLMRGQIQTYANLVNRLNTMTAPEIGKPPPGRPMSSGPSTGRAGS